MRKIVWFCPVDLADGWVLKDSCLCSHFLMFDDSSRYRLILHKYGLEFIYMEIGGAGGRAAVQVTVIRLGIYRYDIYLLNPLPFNYIRLEY